jgi:hypothetical protein
LLVIKKIFISSGIYLVLVVVAKYIFSPEKYIYGHQYEYKFFEFIAAVIVIPASAFLFYFAKTTKKDRSIGLGVLFLISGFFGLLLSTFIEKTIVQYQLNNDGKVIIGIVDYTYTTRRGSNSHPRRVYYNFIASFQIKNESYYSLPGFTEKEIYKVGDTVTVRYLDRNPFLNEIFYKKE